MNSGSGNQVFVDFVKKVNSETTIEFDYFHFLDHLSNNKIDKDGLLKVLKESKFILISIKRK